MRQTKKGKMVVFDGIDGSGKGTLVGTLARWARSKNMRVLNVVAFEQRRHRLPEPEEIKQYDVLLTAEPTHSLVGRAIRHELTQHNERQYSARAIAEAYALDRYILLQRVIIPALAQGKYIFQERSASTSFVYQPLMSRSTPLSFVKQLNGNALALQYRPDLLCILRADVDAVLRRLGDRIKKDQSIFERRTFLTKAQRRFLDPRIHRLYTSRGSRVEIIDTNQPVRQSARQVRELWQEQIS